ncbi:MAG: alkaline phosphatase family protein, partial [Thermoplasmata archaeon]
ETAALTSLSTGLPPSRHGIVGHRQYLPRFGVVADMLRMSPAESAGTDGLAGPDFEPSELTGIPTVFERGLRTTVISRDRFEGTGFTRLLYAGAEYRPYATASDLAFTLARVLDRTDPPEAVLVYWDELDTVQHVHGPEQYLVDLELDRIHHLLRSATGRIAPERLRSVALWLTADHGQVPAPDPQNLRIEQHPELVRELLHAPAGDRRAGYFAVRPGRSEGFREAIAPLLPAATVHRPMAAALAAGWFGPPPFHPEIEARTGTDLVLPPPPVGLTYRPPGGGVRHRPTHGAHGGLEREELWVPLLVGPLAELAGWP